jgi:hypothetical protein
VRWLNIKTDIFEFYYLNILQFNDQQDELLSKLGNSWIFKMGSLSSVINTGLLNVCVL